MSSQIDVIPLERAQRDRAVDAVTRAFVDDPMWSCILPDREARETRLRPMWDALAGFSLVYGDAFSTPDGEGAALWIAPGRSKTTLWMMIRTGFRLPRSMMGLPKEARRRFFRLLPFIDGFHQRLMPDPHWYLWVLGVAPEAQGRGIGRALLRPMLDRADAESIPCYLETQTRGNVTFYAKSGFEVLAEEREPVCGALIWFLVRRPHPSPAEAQPDA